MSDPPRTPRPAGPLPGAGSLLLLLPLLAVPVAALLPPSVHPESGPLLALLLLPGAALAALRGEPVRPAVAALVAGCALLSLLFASARGEAVRFAFLALASLAAWGTGRSLGARRRGRLEAVLAGTGTLLAAHGLYQVLWGFRRILESGAPMEPEVQARLEYGRAFSTFPLPSQLAAFLVLGIPLAVSRARACVGWARRFWGAAALLQAAALAATWSLGGLLALAVAAFSLWPLVRARRWGRPAALGLVALLAVAAAAAFHFRPELAAGVTDPGNPVGLRLRNWGVALRMVRDHPVVGVGPGCFGTRYPAHMRPGMNESDNAHNSYLQLLAELGLWSLAPILLGLGFAARRLRRPRDLRDALAGAACAGFLAANLWDFHIYLPSLSVPFFLLAGAWGAGGRDGEAADGIPPGGPGGSERPAGGPPAPGVASVRLGRALYATTAVILLAGAGLSAVAQARKARALDLWDAGGEVRREALAAWAAASPLDPDPHDLLARARAEQGNLAGAIRAAEKAVSLDPYRPSLHAQLGRLLYRAGDRTGALVELARAAALFPLRPLYREERDRVRAEIEGRAP